AHVEIHSNYDPYPKRNKNEIVWGIGRFSTWLCGAELLRACVSGHVRNVWRVLWYDAGRPFDNWVAEYQRVRRACQDAQDTLGERLAKHVANSLYGKFGQLRERWELLAGEKSDILWGPIYRVREGVEGYEELRSIGGYLQLSHKREESARS